MKALLEFLITSLASNPKKVKIKQTTTEEGELFQISVAQEDMGRVIGKNGQIIKALRTLLRTAAFKQGKRAQLVLEEKVESPEKNP